VTGPVGDHGIAVMSEREGLRFESSLQSDVAPLWGLMRPLFEKTPRLLHCLRDPTRGGIASALCDIAEASNTGIRISETSIPITKEVRGACSLLGLDPLNVANEGKAVILCGQKDADGVLGILRQHELGSGACLIGSVVDNHPGTVVLETAIGGERVMELPSGEELPRIC
jgi:hydrogenase expression/formation protein HypE